LGHKLGKLWQAFKTDYRDPALVRHDTTVSSLDKFEDIRYPPDHSFSVTLQWDGPIYPSPPPTDTQPYILMVSDIDELVADILAKTGWNTGLFFQGPNTAMLDVLTFRNEQKDYLRKVVPGRPRAP
jgi:hypothetical protein